MTKGKLIVIEGIDCSGKGTQTKLLISKFRQDNIFINRLSFPNYQSSTGKIIAGPILGKYGYTPSWFKEGATHIDPKVASLYYAADRKYNIDKINLLLKNGATVILDRYIYSNMAHQGCKMKSKKERNEMYDWLGKLEFELLELPKPDAAIFLHMPIECVEKLKRKREEIPDDAEKDTEHLKMAEKSYMEIAKKYEMFIIECADENGIRSIEDINKEIYEYIVNEFGWVVSPYQLSLWWFHIGGSLKIIAHRANDKEIRTIEDISKDVYDYVIEQLDN